MNLHIDALLVVESNVIVKSMYHYVTVLENGLMQMLDFMLCEGEFLRVKLIQD